MGLLSYLKSLTSRNTNAEIRILILGLDNSGKSTILRRLSDEDILDVRPTQGFQVKTLTQSDFQINMWDVGGQKAIRSYWKNYFDATEALIYVIDSSDRRRMEETGVELQQLLDEEKLTGIPLVIFANKQDLLNALTPAEITQGLNLHSIRDRPWQIFPCSAKENSGITNGMEFLIQELNQRRSMK